MKWSAKCSPLRFRVNGGEWQEVLWVILHRLQHIWYSIGCLVVEFATQHVEWNSGHWKLCCDVQIGLQCCQQVGDCDRMQAWARARVIVAPGGGGSHVSSQFWVVQEK